MNPERLGSANSESEEVLLKGGVSETPSMDAAEAKARKLENMTLEELQQEHKSMDERDEYLEGQRAGLLSKMREAKGGAGEDRQLQNAINGIDQERHVLSIDRSTVSRKIIEKGGGVSEE